MNPGVSLYHTTPVSCESFGGGSVRKTRIQCGEQTGADDGEATLGFVWSREIPAKSSGNEDQTEEKQRRVCLNGLKLNGFLVMIPFKALLSTHPITSLLGICPRNMLS
jgi:hypothetical protein